MCVCAWRVRSLAQAGVKGLPFRSGPSPAPMEETDAPPEAPSLPPPDVLPPDPDLWVEVVRSAALR
eukprot:897285-Alexandrium_andersonii.AAC.1